MKKKKEISMIRSSAAEYLTFITATGESDVNAIYFDENVWLTQKMMGLLYNVETHTINYHLKKIFSDGEIDENAVIRKFRITASDGKSYNTNHYNLKAIIAVGNKVDSPRAVQFRKWANDIIEEFTIKGFVMDDERLKNFGTVLTKDYFEEQLERIREIRLSERRFYQKITDIYATSIDYDSKAQTTRLFFAKVQNQLHWAIHGETAAEVIYHRADSEKQNMGLQTWKDAPSGKIQRFDVTVAKNYLTEQELSAMARIVNAYLDLAEIPAMICIIGVMIGYIANAVIGVLKFFSVEEDIRAYVIWGLGSFARVSGDQMTLFICIMVVLLPLSFLLVKTLNLLLLGDAYARNLGLNIKRARLLVITCSGVLVAIVTAYCGPIIFLGLAVPHLCRGMFRTSDHRILMPASLLAGASLALVCNLIARMPGFEGALPVNSVTALVGAPVVMSVLFNKRRNEMNE